MWREQNQANQQGVETIQEVSVQVSNFAAEYGQVGGGYFNYTMKSGTNQFYGSAYDYFQNEFLNSPGGGPIADPLGRVFPTYTIFDPNTARPVNGQQVEGPFTNNTVPVSRMDPVALKFQERQRHFTAHGPVGRAIRLPGELEYHRPGQSIRAGGVQLLGPSTHLIYREPNSSLWRRGHEYEVLKKTNYNCFQ